MFNLGMNPEKLLAGLALAVCAVMLLRLALPEPRRVRFDRALLRSWQQLASFATNLIHWPTRRRQARQAALDAITRAQKKSEAPLAKGQWKGNVYTPDSFGSGRDGDAPSKRDLH
jgi:hypothetical protein